MPSVPGYYVFYDRSRPHTYGKIVKRGPSRPGRVCRTGDAQILFYGALIGRQYVLPVVPVRYYGEKTVIGPCVHTLRYVLRVFWRRYGHETLPTWSPSDRFPWDTRRTRPLLRVKLVFSTDSRFSICETFVSFRFVYYSTTATINRVERTEGPEAIADE